MTLKADNGFLMSQTDAKDSDTEDALQRLKEREASWVKDKQDFEVEIQVIKSNRSEIERDLAFFREQYSVASSFTDQLRTENKVLHERIGIAESQATRGVELVRATLAAQIRKLTDELAKAQGALRVLTERDRRTDDAVRKRAAMESELRGKMIGLKTKYAALKDDIQKLLHERDDLLIGAKTLNEQLDVSQVAYKDSQVENRSLRVELARFTARERTAASALFEPIDNDSDVDAEGEYEYADEEDVYLCAWAVTENGDRCNAVFTTREVGKHFLQFSDRRR